MKKLFRLLTVFILLICLGASEGAFALAAEMDVSASASFGKISGATEIAASESAANKFSLAPVQKNVIFSDDEILSGVDLGKMSDDSIIVRMAGGSIVPLSSSFLGVEVEEISELMTLAQPSKTFQAAFAPPDTLKVLRLKNKGRQAISDALALLNNSPAIVYAEPNYIVHSTQTIQTQNSTNLAKLTQNSIAKTGAGVVPNDTDFATPSMWGVKKIHAPYAWNTQTGSSDVVVAVIDTGIDITHPDLTPNIWQNTSEIAGDNIDNDSNGFVDDTHGWGFIWETDSSNAVMDSNGHGTHVAGIIGAVGNNNLGMTGTSWNTRLMSVKGLANMGAGYTSDLIQAINYASLMGADIINNSYGGGEFSQAQKDAIAASSALFVVAAGNDGQNIDYAPTYPAAYDCPNIITVAATDKTDNLTDFSNFGVNAVDIAAPGDDIFSTLPLETYGLMSGTSMAAPFVAGVAALVLAQNPTFSAVQIKERLLLSATPIAALSGLVASGGRLNAYKAVDPDAPDLPDYQAESLPVAPNFVEFAGGDGTAAHPYQVSTPLQLNSVRKQVDKHYIQINDIDMTFDTQNPLGAFYNETQGWLPIGAVSSSSGHNFIGTYNGGKYKIKGLRVARAAAILAGLFGVNEGTLTNIGLEDCTIIGAQPGGITARGYGGLISDCYVTGRVAGTSGYVGGIMSMGTSEITRCHNAATVGEYGDYVAIVGGIMSTGGNINNCYNTGDVVAPYAKDIRLGGIMSYPHYDSIVKNCYSVGNAINKYGVGKAAIASSGNGGAVLQSNYCAGNYSGYIGKVLTDNQLKNKTSFVGWDFENVWNIHSYANNGYPYLRSVQNKFEDFVFAADISHIDDFSAVVGYTLTTIKMIKITNTGNCPTGQLNMTLEGDPAFIIYSAQPTNSAKNIPPQNTTNSVEDLSVAEGGALMGASAYGISVANIEVGGFVEFRISCRMGLAVGEYNATLVVTGESGISARRNIAMVVEAVEDIELELSLGNVSQGIGGIVPTGWSQLDITKASGSDKIVWNSATGKLEISEGIKAGRHKVVLESSSGQQLVLMLTVGTQAERIEQLEKDYAGLEVLSGQLAERIEQLKGEIGALSARLSGLEGGAVETGLAVEVMFSELERLQKEILVLETRLSKLIDTDFSDAEGLIELLREDIEMMQGDIKGFESQLTEIIKTVEAQMERIEQLEIALSNSQKKQAQTEKLAVIALTLFASTIVFALIYLSYLIYTRRKT